MSARSNNTSITTISTIQNDIDDNEFDLDTKEDTISVYIR